MSVQARRWLVALAMLLCIGIPGVGHAQDTLRVLSDTTRVQVLHLRDGSTMIGRVIALRDDSLEIRTEAGQLTIARASVRSVRERPAASIRGGEYWPEDPNATRLFFAPTARMLERGDGYFCDIWLFLLCLTGGVTDRVTFGGGMSLVPGIAVADNVFYVTPKIGVVSTERVNLAVGAFAGWSGAVTNEASSFGILYGVGTYGTADHNVSAGVGYAYFNDDVADRPLLLVGAKLRMTRGTMLISENYILPNSEGAIGSLGVRFFGERIAGDVALVRFSGRAFDDDAIVIPFVGLAVKFR